MHSECWLLFDFTLVGQISYLSSLKGHLIGTASQIPTIAAARSSEALSNEVLAQSFTSALYWGT